jgi:hypothetical protein
MARLPDFLRWGPYDTPGGWLRGLAIMLASAAFLASAGAVGATSGSLPLRFG